MQPPPAALVTAGHVTDDVLEFVRFCYRRRSVAWPQLYDEMCAVAAGGAFQGLSYDDLAARGIRFSLGDLPKLAAVTDQVALDEGDAEPPRPS